MLQRFIIPVLLLALLPLSGFSKSKLSKEEKTWLYKVDFIITTEERRIFKKRLSQGYERSKFIDLFWAKRDPDLTDNVNPFKDEYLARYDYVMTHYENGRYNIPKDDRSFIYMLLGKPDTVEPRVDITIMGANWRNKILQHRPELWTYKEMDYGYRRQKLKIQLVPTSSFGDYVAYMDNYSINWLRRVKYKFIVNPDLEVAPPNSGSGSDGFRNVVDLDQESSEAVASAVPVKAVPGEPIASADMSAAARIEAEVAAEEKPTPPPTTPLAVPTPVAAPDENRPVVKITEKPGNPSGLQARMGYFMSGNTQTLLLLRMGFPLSKLDFDFLDNQFRAPFTLRYILQDQIGKALQSDIIDGNIALPDLDSVKKKNTYYSREFAANVKPGRYVLKVELKETNKNRLSYFETELEVPPLDRSGMATSDLYFMDRNVDPRSASFAIGGKAYGFFLPPSFAPKARLHPVIEIFGNPGDDSLDSIQMHAMKDGKIEHSWVLYPEEMTLTNYNTVLVHPELRTSVLGPGQWQLQFEMELANGELLLSETQFVIEGKTKSR